MARGNLFGLILLLVGGGAFVLYAGSHLLPGSVEPAAPAAVEPRGEDLGLTLILMAGVALLMGLLFSCVDLSDAEPESAIGVQDGEGPEEADGRTVVLHLSEWGSRRPPAVEVEWPPRRTRRSETSARMLR